MSSNCSWGGGGWARREECGQAGKGGVGCGGVTAKQKNEVFDKCMPILSYSTT